MEADHWMAGGTMPPALLIGSLLAHSSSSKYSSTRWRAFKLKMFARLDQPYKRLRALEIPSNHSRRTNIETKSDQDTGSSPKAWYWSQSKKWWIYIVSLQKGQGRLRGDKHENLVKLARNKINNLADSNVSSPRASPKARGIESVGKRETRWFVDPYSRVSRSWPAKALARCPKISPVRSLLNKSVEQRSIESWMDGTALPGPTNPVL